MRINNKESIKALSLISETITILTLDGINSKQIARDHLKTLYKILKDSFYQKEGYVIIEDDNDYNTFFLSINDDGKLEWKPLLEDALRFEERVHACQFLEKHDYRGIYKIKWVSETGALLGTAL